MLRRTRYKRQKQAQILLEYTLVIGATILVLVAMGTMIRRVSQGMIKVVADEIGNQVNADQLFDDRGHLMSSNAYTEATTSKTREEIDGDIEFIYADITETESTSLVNLGFTPEN